jgi:predicted phage baseplate assembly protein
MDFWVRWTRVNDFLDSKSKDRHYTIDKTDGDVSFGNGKRGMIPPIGPDNIKATYSIGGGKSGNFDALKISKLQSSIAFVDKVFNPTSSNGGTETEDIDSLLKRAPTVLKNRDRAMALEDYEWLAKKASDEVSRVKALPNFNSERKFSTGWVTVVIVPESSNSKPVPSSELKRRVTSYLKERCPAVVTLRVIPPYYIKVDVSAELITASIDAIPLIEKEARTKISEFLHPLTGSTERNGWRFGGILCISDIYFILEQIKDVDYVNKVIINLYDDSGVTGSTMKLSDASTLAKLPEYALPYSGEHEIIVKWKNNETEG